MRSYSQVYKQSRQSVLAEKSAIIEAQKVQVVNALKEEYMIESMSALPPQEKEKMKKKLLEYWSPKTGLKKAGERLLNESVINLDGNSRMDDIRRYVKRETFKNIDAVVECFRNAQSSLVVENLQKCIYEKTKTKVSAASIKDLVWSVVSDKIKNL